MFPSLYLHICMYVQGTVMQYELIACERGPDGKYLPCNSLMVIKYKFPVESSESSQFSEMRF